MKTTGFFKRADEFGLVTKITKQTKEARSLKKPSPLCRAMIFFLQQVGVGSQLVQEIFIDKLNNLNCSLRYCNLKRIRWSL